MLTEQGKRVCVLGEVINELLLVLTWASASFGREYLGKGPLPSGKQDLLLDQSPVFMLFEADNTPHHASTHLLPAVKTRDSTNNSVLIECVQKWARYF